VTRWLISAVSNARRALPLKRDLLAFRRLVTRARDTGVKDPLHQLGPLAKWETAPCPRKKSGPRLLQG
jgi:hypothetical protein